jgi:hypothetical protein
MPKRTLDIDMAVKEITHFFRFAMKMARTSQCPSWRAHIAVSQCDQRVLYSIEDPRRLLDAHIYHNDQVTIDRTYDREQISTICDALSADVLVAIFERFGWLDVKTETVARIQKDLLPPA